MPLNWMFLNHFQADEDVEENPKTIENSIELVYLVSFHLITFQADLDMRKVWVFLSRRWLGLFFKMLFGIRQTKVWNPNC